MHHSIPSLNGADLQRIRRKAKTELLKEFNGRFPEILPKTRVSTLMSSPDGSATEIELAAEFLKRKRR